MGIYGKEVRVYKYISDPSAEPRKDYCGHLYQPTIRAFHTHGICIGLGTDYKELGNSEHPCVGQFTTMVVLHNDGTFGQYPLHMIEEV